jgi:hypothetical protein
MARLVHDRRFLSQGELVVVKCNEKCNIRLIDDGNFHKFRNGKEHEFCGGFYHILPANIVVPKSGYWNIAIDAGELAGNLTYEISYIGAGTTARGAGS